MLPEGTISVEAFLSILHIPKFIDHRVTCLEQAHWIVADHAVQYRIHRHLSSICTCCCVSGGSAVCTASPVVIDIWHQNLNHIVELSAVGFIEVIIEQNAHNGQILWHTDRPVPPVSKYSVMVIQNVWKSAHQIVKTDIDRLFHFWVIVVLCSLGLIRHHEIFDTGCRGGQRGTAVAVIVTFIRPVQQLKIVKELCPFSCVHIDLL